MKAVVKIRSINNGEEWYEDFWIESEESMDEDIKPWIDGWNQRCPDDKREMVEIVETFDEEKFKLTGYDAYELVPLENGEDI